MNNPFTGRAVSLDGPARDIVPVVPNDNLDLESVAVTLYVETGGTLAIVTVTGDQRTVTVGDLSFLPVGTARVLATGTTASGIHALVVA